MQLAIIQQIAAHMTLRNLAQGRATSRSPYAKYAHNMGIIGVLFHL